MRKKILLPVTLILHRCEPCKAFGADARNCVEAYLCPAYLNAIHLPVWWPVTGRIPTYEAARLLFTVSFGQKFRFAEFCAFFKVEPVYTDWHMWWKNVGPDISLRQLATLFKHFGHKLTIKTVET